MIHIIMNEGDSGTIILFNCAQLFSFENKMESDQIFDVIN